MSTLLFMLLFGMYGAHESKTFSKYRKPQFFSNIVHKIALIHVSEHFSFAEVISKARHITMLILTALLHKSASGYPHKKASLKCAVLNYWGI